MRERGQSGLTDSAGYLRLGLSHTIGGQVRCSVRAQPTGNLQGSHTGFPLPTLLSASILRLLMSLGRCFDGRRRIQSERALSHANQGLLSLTFPLEPLILTF